MPKSTATCNSIVNLMYRATAWANVADNAASSPLTNTYVSLHTSNLTASTNQQSENETAYTNYARQAVARSTGWGAASSGAPVFRDLGDTTDRITATTDDDGNRVSVTYDAA